MQKVSPSNDSDPNLPTYLHHPVTYFFSRTRLILLFILPTIVSEKKQVAPSRLIQFEVAPSRLICFWNPKKQVAPCVAAHVAER